ncbi:MAG TPA: SOS response-associated peptidase [Opitutaceae bacterium]|nr:SOS response-associated peptidase [Opitutaceae bacterium]
MCGRYRIKNTAAINELIRRLFGLPAWTPGPLAPRFNIAPSQEMPVLALGEGEQPVVTPMRWGLIPYWETEDAPKIRPINAQAENVVTKAMFKQAVQRRRCLVAADGFYEWRRLDEKTKQPFDIHLKDGRPFFFAGIYERATAQRPATYAILTTRANELMATIHTRMPAILEGDTARRWMAAGEITPETVAELTAPHLAADMEAIPVSSLVNSPARDVPECLERVAELERPPAKPVQQELW